MPVTVAAVPITRLDALLDSVVRDAGYAALWNAFTRLAAGASAEEKGALFSGTARRAYRLD